MPVKYVCFNLSKRAREFSLNRKSHGDIAYRARLTPKPHTLD